MWSCRCEMPGMSGSPAGCVSCLCLCVTLSVTASCVCVCVCVCVCLSVYMPSSSRKVALTKRPTRDASHCAGHATAYSQPPPQSLTTLLWPAARPTAAASDRPPSRCRSLTRLSHTARRVRHEHGGRTTGERGSRARAPAAGPKSVPPWEGCSASQPSTLSGPPARTVECSLMD